MGEVTTTICDAFIKGKRERASSPTHSRECGQF
jgi:hypothetical protein